MLFWERVLETSQKMKSWPKVGSRLWPELAGLLKGGLPNPQELYGGPRGISKGYVHIAYTWKYRQHIGPNMIPNRER